MKRKSPFGFLALSLVALLSCALSLRFVAVTLPKSAPGENLLRWEYARADDESVYLREYRARIWEHGGGYVPAGAAQFFAAQLNNGDDKEVAAIARFYASQGGMRDGNFAQMLTEKARQRLVDAILRDWRTCPEKEAWRAFAFIETLRQNQYLGKTHIVGPIAPYSYAKLAPIAAKFDSWNRRYRALPIPTRPFPLAGTGYVIEAP